MFQGIEPSPFFIRNVFGNHIPQLFDQRQLPVFRIEIAEKAQGGEFGFLSERCDESARHAFQVGSQRPCQRDLPLQGEFRLERQRFDPREHGIENRRPRSPESRCLFISVLHGFLL